MWGVGGGVGAALSQLNLIGSTHCWRLACLPSFINYCPIFVFAHAFWSKLMVSQIAVNFLAIVVIPVWHFTIHSTKVRLLSLTGAVVYYIVYVQ